MTTETPPAVLRLSAELGATSARLDNTCTDCNELIPWCRCRSAGSVGLRAMDGREVSPGVYLVGEPTPIAGTDKLRCLANVGGALALVELRIRFLAPNARLTGAQQHEVNDE